MAVPANVTNNDVVSAVTAPTPIPGSLSEYLPETLLRLIPVDNPIFSGGFGLAAMGVGFKGLQRSGTVISELARRHLMMTLEVTSKDPTYPWVMRWLNSHGRRTQHLSVSTVVEQKLDGSSRLSFDLVPGPGRHLVRYKNWPFLVDMHREHQAFATDTGTPWEKVVLTSIGRNVSLFDDLLADARAMSEREVEGATVIYKCWGDDWRQFGHPRRKRPLSSVVLGDGVKEAIVADVREWCGAAAWYRDRGIPYRRGYLLHGPPGSGKSSFIAALAGEIDYNICYLSLSDDSLSDDYLEKALSVVPQRSIVLLEDIDAAFGSRELGDVRYPKGNLTFSGLLNALDGVASSEGRIIFMTTNYIDRLDPALLRPGRVDSVHLLGAATESQARRLFQKFYADADPALADMFAGAVAALPTPPSMAELQGHLMDHKGQPGEAARAAPALRGKVEERARRTAAQKDEARRMASLAGYDMGKGMRESARGTAGKRGGGRRITAEQVDKMPFNPQPGWEEAVGLK